ncbi:hypothetical protein DXG01_000019 [Tephrocybe rancida]|nr:hypothetical protein DXG01_000019 [Tephrocybe rancida]
MTSINTSQGFIRALKATSDPPVQGGPLKIKIARQAWDNHSFYVPNKAEVIVEWIMGKFLKEKDKETTLNPLLDLRFWTLLHDVVSSSAMGLGVHMRPLKAWLPSLLTRIPLAPTLVYVTFLQNFLPHWLELVSLQGSDATLSDIIYDSGVETLFNLDVLRWTRDSRTENHLFEAITPVLTSNIEVFAVLPRLFSSYIDSIKKHRGALVSQSSTQAPGAAKTEIQTQGMQFFASCLLLLDADENLHQTWSARVALLKVVDREGLFERSNVEAAILLDRVLGQSLSKIDMKASTELSVFGVECLSTIARIDYDIIVPLLPRILPKLFMIPDPDILYLKFLGLILEYHSKTRTTNSYTQDLFSALSITSIHHSPGDIYLYALSSPLLNATHLQHLSKALQTFLGESQALSLTKSIFDILKEEWEKFNGAESDTEERSPKRRKTMDINTAGSTNPEHQSAVVFSVSARLAMTVFSSLPMRAVTEEVRDELRDLLNEIRTFLRRIVKRSMKALKRCDADKKWSLSIVSAASLRLCYTLDILGNIPEAPFDDGRLFKRALEAIQDEQLLPELLVELSRFLFCTSLARDSSSSQAAFNHILLYLEKNFKVSAVSWSGQVHRLTHSGQGEMECALGLMHMILERWLPVIESFASTEQLERLVNVIMSIDITPNPEPPPSGLQVQTLLLQTLHSAQFWELPKFRVTLLTYINHLISAPSDATTESSLELISKTVGAYSLLLMLPVEYLSRSSRSEFTRKALALDRQISASNMPTPSKYRPLVILRVFLNRIFTNPNGSDFPVEQLCEASEHFMSPTTLPLVLDEGLEATTMSLLESVFFETFKKSEKSSSALLLKIVCAFEKIDTQVTHQTLDVRSRSLIHMVAVLEREFKLNSLSDGVQSAMRKLYKNLSMAIYPQLSTFDPGTMPVELTRYTSLVTLWRSLLCFRKWLGSVAPTEDSSPSLAPQLVSRLLSWDGSSAVQDETRVAAVAALLEEFNFCPEKDRASYLNYVVAAFTHTHLSLRPSARQQAEGFLSKTCSKLSASEFSQLLDLITDDLKRNNSHVARIRLLQVSTNLLRNHPSGTLKQMQMFSSRYIQTFLGWRDLFDGPIELRLQTLEFVAHHCTEQPAVLRAGDMGSIWSLLTTFLAGSCVHDNDTTSQIFHNIINIVSALVRLRRDLVVPTLPHLGSVLRQLLMSVRTVRPNLGIKQTSLVTDTLPRWLNATHPIGVEEVKALARLLETLTAKSMVRNNTSNLETQKAESLSKPFSKHAAYVLKAYITAMNDPLCMLPSEHRKELHRGLYALCSMISDHSRDALMVGALDAGGKTTMKALWKDYEKQRYIGKG